MTHLSRDALLRWRDAPLAADRAAIGEHLAVCDVCSGRYAELIRTRPLEGTSPTLNVNEFIAAGASRNVSPADHTYSSRNVAVRWALAAAAVAVLSVLSWQTFEALRLRSQLTQAETARIARDHESAQRSSDDQARIQQLDRELREERNTRAILEGELAGQREPTRVDGGSRRAVLSLFLSLGRIRGSGETKTLTIPRDAAAVRLVLDLGEQRAYRSYQVAILNADGEKIWSRSGLPAGRQLVLVTVPASLLREDDYEIDLQGLTRTGAQERAGDYYFRVLKP